MKKYSKFLQIITLFVVIAAFMFSCVDDNFDIPPITEKPIGAIYTIQQVKDSLASGTYQFKNEASVYATVTMDNETDNCYKTFYIQDNTAAIAVFQDVSGGVYIGDSVRIYLKDLVVMKYSQLFQLNTLAGTGINVESNVIKQGYNNKRTPEETTIAEIIADSASLAYFQGRLVKIHDVQFVSTDTSKTYAISSTTPPTNVNLYIQDSIDNHLIVRTSGYASFADSKVPNGSGSIIAIVGQFNSDIQLVIRKASEVEMTNTRFDISGGGNPDTPTPNTTIDQLKALFTGGANDFQQISGNIVIEATVVANDQNGNYYKAIVIQDATSGITLKINDYDLFGSFEVGRKIVIDCNGLYLGAYAGLIQLGSTYIDGIEKFGGIQPSVLDNYVYRLDDIVPLSPTVLNINTISDSDLGKLVQFNDVQFGDAFISSDYLGGGTANFNIDLEDCPGNIILVRTSSYADFANNPVETGKGTFIGILAKFNTDYQLYIRDINELDMTGARCAK